jgi:diadenosine tetraphosphatase ApaH/serine/threonine PP2A family protein phosphatase
MRILVLSDIHSNLVALDTVLTDAGAVDRVWQLGDIVGYGPDPDGVVARLREIGAIGVRGNHDAAAAGGHEIDMFNVDARRAMEWTRARITPATQSWLAGLPDVLAVDDWTLVHGSPRDPMWEYITSAQVARANLARIDTPRGLFGHTHLPLVFREHDGRIETLSPADEGDLPLDGRRLLANPGSVGQPRDGNPQASYAVIDTTAATLQWARVVYDIARVQAAMRTAGLPDRLAARLSFGL